MDAYTNDTRVFDVSISGRNELQDTTWLHQIGIG